ncbi:MAG TPA: NAD-binding protein, partial [Candidatus Obscuribacterales bacterium]
ITVLSQGLTASLLARVLGLTGHKNGNGAVIVGCAPLSLLIARLLQENGAAVALIDTNAEARELAETENIPVFVNSALEASVLEEAGIGAATTLLAITNNSDVNAVVAQQAQAEFSLPRIIAVVPLEDAAEDTPKKSAPKKNAAGGKSAAVKAAFPTIALKTWNGYLQAGTVRLGETVLRHEGALMQRAHLRTLIRNGALLPLLVRRADRLWIALTEEEDWKPGDRLVYLFHDAKPKLLQRLSGGSRPTRLAIETVPTVEDVPLPTKVTIPPPPPTEGEGATQNGQTAAPAVNPSVPSPVNPAADPPAG